MPWLSSKVTLMLPPLGKGLHHASTVCFIQVYVGQTNPKCALCAVEPELSYALSQVLRMLITWLDCFIEAVRTLLDMDGFTSTLLQLATKR